MNNSSLRIALPISSFLPSLGGMEVGLHNIASGLKDRGHEPVVISSATYVRKLRKLKLPLSYEVVSFPPKIWSILYRFPSLGFFILDQYFKFLQYKYKFDVWHVTMGYPTGVAVTHFAEKNKGILHLIRCAGEDIQMMPEINYGYRLDPSIDKLMKLYLPKCPMLIAITESVAQEYDSIGVNKSNIKNVPNGVSNKRFDISVDKDSIKKSLGLDLESFLFISVGRNHPKKNMASLINIAKKLKLKTNLKFQILIVGNKLSELNDLVIESNLDEIVILKEQVGSKWKENIKEVPRLPSDDLVAYYKIADAFVFPTLIETFGIVIIEAMSAGLPVIVTDVPGCKDIVRKNIDGIVVPEQDDDAFSEAMNLLMNDKALFDKYSNQSKKRALEYDWDNVIDKYYELYKELILTKNDL